MGDFNVISDSDQSLVYEQIVFPYEPLPKPLSRRAKREKKNKEFDLQFSNIIISDTNPYQTTLTSGKREREREREEGGGWGRGERYF